MPRRLLSLLCAAACSTAPGAEPIVATPYEVRHEIQELLDDLSSKRGDRAALLDRVQTALAEHGDRLLLRDGVAQPLAELLVATLTDAGLAGEFVRAFSPVADRRLQALAGPAASTAELRRIARGYPGTPAAREAWRLLADRAWDTGSLASFLAYARQAHDGDDQTRKPRVIAATGMALPPAGAHPPDSVEGIEELWRLPVGEPPVIQRGRQRAIDRLEITTGPAEVSAISDGFNLRLIDHVVGRQLGDAVQIGNQPLALAQLRPVALRDGFAAVGMLSNQPHIVAMDAHGRLRWRQCLSTFERAVVSAPASIDDLVVMAVVAMTRDGSDLQVVALRSDSGHVAWTAQIARLQGARPMVLAASESAATPPVLAVAGGTLVLCANNGLMARIGADGVVQRVWSYPTIFDDLNSIMSTRTGPRGGIIVSDGRTTACSPADYPGTVLVLGPDDAAPRAYTGDNANGEVVAARDGLALLAGRHVTLLDLATLKPRWTAPCAGDGPVRGLMGGKRILVAGRGRLTMLATADGRIIAERSQPDLPLSLAVVDDALVLAQSRTVTGLGRGESFLERLTAATRRDPDDYRPLVALASLFEARGDRPQAFDSLVKALGRNAPQEYAERAARLVRRDLELAAGNAKAFPTAFSQLEAIVRFDRRLETELGWWRGRHAELGGDKAQAAHHYRASLAAMARPLLFANDLEVDVHSLAEAGLARLGAVAPPAWLFNAAVPTPAAPSIGAWLAPGSPPQHLLVTDHLTLGLVDGLLTARHLSDGREAWWRTPGRALLGVSWRGFPLEDNQPAIPGADVVRGLMVEVMPGSAAAAAGMRSGDRMLSFNGRPTTDFDRDLRTVVLNMIPRAPFTVEVERNRQVMTLRGNLGGDLVQPIAAGGGLALVWPLAFLPGTNRPLVPEGMWFAAHDLADGKELWRWSLPPVTAERVPIPPLLTSQGLVITQDGGDVVGLATPRTPGEGPEVRWRVNGAALGLMGARLLTPHLLWLPHGSGVALVDVDNGRTRIRLPVAAGAQALLADGELAVRDTDGRPTLWDLALARQRWQAENGVALLAFCGDGLLVLDEARRPALLDRVNGSLRRTIGDWTMVEDWRVTADTVLVHARREGRQVLASIALPGATIRWEVALSSRAEIKSLLAGGGTWGCVLGDGPERDSLLLLDGNGAPRTTLRLAPNESVVATFANGVALIQGSEALRTVVPTLPTAPAHLPAVATAATGDLATIALNALPHLAWQTLGNARYAVARSRNGMLVFADLPPGSPPLEVMLSDLSPVIEVAGAPIRFTADGPVFSVVAGSWLMGGTVRLDAPPGILRRDCVRLDPPPGHLPGMPLSVRASCGNATDAADAPWWLHQGWREVR